VDPGITLQDLLEDLAEGQYLTELTDTPLHKVLEHPGLHLDKWVVREQGIHHHLIMTMQEHLVVAVHLVRVDTDTTLLLVQTAIYMHTVEKAFHQTLVDLLLIMELVDQEQVITIVIEELQLLGAPRQEQQLQLSPRRAAVVAVQDSLIRVEMGLLDL
jgi:hypothetical protein